MHCLTFRLYGPMASWGGTAIGGVRPTRAVPSRSAILGLLAAALGITRAEEAKLAALSDSVEIAVKTESEGVLLRDYHTAQVPSRERKALWLHRKAELENSLRSLNTILSTRDYRADGHWCVALAAKPGAAYSLEEIAGALARPVFPLFLGRKSCPPSAPLNPRLLECDSLREALDKPSGPISFKASADQRLLQDDLRYEWEGDRMGMEPAESWQGWDQPLSRKRWQFTKRLIKAAQMKRGRDVSIES